MRGARMEACKPEPVRDAVTRVVKYRFKPSAELVGYMRGMQGEYASLVNAGVEGVQALRCHHAERYLYDIICNPSGRDAELHHDSVTGETHCVYVGTPKNKKHLGVKATIALPMAFAHGAIKDGVTRVSTRGSYMRYGPGGRGRRRQHRLLSMRSTRTLDHRSQGYEVYLPGHREPFILREPLKINKGKMMGYRLVDVTEKWENPADSDRKIELHVTYRIDVTPHMGTDVVAGVDPGGRYTAAVSYLKDGKEIGSQLVQMDFRDERQRLRKLHQERSRCRRGSRRYGELTRQIQKIHRKIDRRWLHQAYQQANHVIHQADMVRFEGSNFDAMGAAGGNSKRGMNRTVNYARPGEFREITLDKTQEAGKTYEEIRPKNTSKRCFPCRGYEAKRKKDELTCCTCGDVRHADINAGSNIGSGDFDTIEWSERARNAAKLEARFRESRWNALHGMGAVPAPDGHTPEGEPHDNPGTPRHPAVNPRQPEAPPGPPACAGGSHTPSKGKAEPSDGCETTSDNVSTPDASRRAAHACKKYHTHRAKNMVCGGVPHAVADGS